MLWDSIFEFFVKYIFGGRLSNNQTFNGIMGMAFDETTGGWASNPFTSTTMVYSVRVGNYTYSYPLGNYLSLIATIISITIILILCCLFIKKIISLMGKLFSGGTL